MGVQKVSGTKGIRYKRYREHKVSDTNYKMYQKQKLSGNKRHRLRQKVLHFSVIKKVSNLSDICWLSRVLDSNLWRLASDPWGLASDSWGSASDPKGLASDPRGKGGLAYLG